MSRWRYWWRLARFFAVALAALLFVTPVALGILTAWALTHPPCSLGPTPAEYAIPYEAITFPSARQITQEGYFMPGDNGATVIIAPAFANGRGGDLRYADVFHRAGFNVLTMNSRVCTSYRQISLGYQEVEDVEAALRYLETRPDVDMNRITIHGFSSAGATSLMSAARFPQLRAVSAEGGYEDFAMALGVGQSADLFTTLFRDSKQFAYRLIVGDEISTLSPLSVIDEIAPRPILLIYGSREVTLSGAYAMIERAGSNAQLWVVEGADHGQYLEFAREEFEHRVPAFHLDAVTD